MSFYNFFHTFFEDGEDYRFHNGSDNNENSNEGRGRNSIFDHIEKDRREFFSDFHKMTNPFELHDFFMKRVNELFDASFFEFPDFGEFQNHPPAIKENVNPRDHYLKPGFNKSPSNESYFGEGHQGTGEWSRTQTSYFKKIESLPDGMIKTKEIIKDADGTVTETETISSLDDYNQPQLPFPDFGISGIWGEQDDPFTIQDPKYDFLKPGYESSNSNQSKIDKDLDEEVSETGVENLPSLSEKPFNSTENFFQIFATHDGVAKTKETFKVPDCTEETVDTNVHKSKKTGYFGLTAEIIQDIGDLLFK